MKLLTTEAQEALLNLLGAVNSDDLEVQHNIVYWRIELKPKRTRKKNEEKILTGMAEAVQYAVDTVPVA